MATVYRPIVTKAVPEGAEILNRKGKQYARWKTKAGKTRTEPVTTTAKGDRIRIRSSKYVAKYRDGSGIVRKVATGCRDETAARSVLAELVRRAELVKSNVLSAAEDAAADHQRIPLSQHLAAYGDHVRAKGVSRTYRENAGRYLRRLASECRFAMLVDLDRAAMERWLAKQAAAGMSARSRNAHLAALIAFCNWCVDTRRLAVNPFARMKKANEKADRRRQRRAMTEDELVRLLDVARRRPLLDRMTIRRGRRKGEAVANLKDSTRANLERLGRERALIYKTLVLTGLRRGELASLTAGDLDLNGPVPYAVLSATNEKNRQGSEIPLRDDLAADLRRWLHDKLESLQSEARRRFEPIPVRLTVLDTPVFVVPKGLVRILDRDLKLAGIPKRDERGRTLDVHALRHTFGSHLSKGGVAPRTAQAAMRHSDIALTMNVYTDPRLLDVRGALEVLPDLPLDGNDRAASQQATGTDGMSREFVPGFVPNMDRTGANGTSADKGAVLADERVQETRPVVSAESDKRNDPLSSSDNESLEVEPIGIEPTTSCMPCKRSPN